MSLKDPFDIFHMDSSVSPVAAFQAHHVIEDKRVKCVWDFWDLVGCVLWTKCGEECSYYDAGTIWLNLCFCRCFCSEFYLLYTVLNFPQTLSVPFWWDSHVPCCQQRPFCIFCLLRHFQQSWWSWTFQLQPAHEEESWAADLQSEVCSRSHAAESSVCLCSEKEKLCQNLD